jgi:hypothetical protein
LAEQGKETMKAHQIIARPGRIAEISSCHVRAQFDHLMSIRGDLLNHSINWPIDFSPFA